MEKTFIKKLYEIFKEHSPYRFADFLDTPQENKEIDKARIEIKNMLQYCFFPIISLIFLIIYCETTKISKQEGTGYIFFGYIIILIIWFLIIIHFDKKKEKKLKQLA